MDSDRQLALFTAGELEGQARLGSRRSHLHQMTSDYLQEWKAKIFRHQQQARESVPAQQITLFDISPAHWGVVKSSWLRGRTQSLQK